MIENVVIDLLQLNAEIMTENFFQLYFEGLYIKCLEFVHELNC